MLQICLNLPGQKFVDPPFEEEILAFIKKLGYSKNMKSLFDAKVDTIPQPWRTFETIINKFLSGKKKLPAKGLETLSEVALSEQMKIATKKSKTQFHCSQASGSEDDDQDNDDADNS
nr:hypothetical protein [Tanacetum cinerariifolium]